MAEIELKPCPWCGADEIEIRTSAYSPSCLYIYCCNCGSRGPIVSSGPNPIKVAEIEAASFWNKGPQFRQGSEASA